MNWFENSLKMREPWALNNAEYLAMADAFELQSEEEDMFGKDWLESYLTNTILDTKYKKIDIADIAEKQKQAKQAKATIDTLQCSQ